MAERYVVVMSAGSLMEPGGSVMAHELIPEGISVRCEETGTHVVHMAVAATVVGQVWRGAIERGRPLHGAMVRVEGAVESTGGGDGDAGDDSVAVEYSVAVDSAMLPEDVDALVASVDPVGHLPASMHGGIEVRRVGHA
ncbi:hypothetical protein [Nocardioides marmoraquaticus]